MNLGLSRDPVGGLPDDRASHHSATPPRPTRVAKALFSRNLPDYRSSNRKPESTEKVTLRDTCGESPLQRNSLVGRELLSP
jgi:hypothetical protein